MRMSLVLGGARSGKSAHALAQAEAHAARTGAELVFIATGEALDAEMAERIARHRAERSGAWRTVETPLDLAVTLDALQDGQAAVVDCLTLWLSNAMLAEDGRLAERTADLVAAAARVRGPVWLVSNEVGWGVAPDNALARRFRDEAGRLHQALAAVADDVVLVVAGLPLRLK